LAPVVKYTEEQLIQRLTAQDKEAFSYLYDNYSGAIYGTLIRIVNEEEIAQDLLQETFVKIWKSFALYNAEKGRLYTWMVNIARNLAIDHKRSRSFKSSEKNQDIDKSVGAINRSQKTVFNIDRIGLKEIVEKLKPESREMINLLYYGGYTQEEASKELGMPLGTVKTRTRTALIELRKLIG
jgi:RNA polymerase sigma-70 factor (ECF subfamily)